MLRTRMESLNLTGTQLGHRLGTSQSAVSLALAGETRFDIFRTEKWCDALEWPVEAFLHEYESTAPDVAGPLADEDDQALTGQQRNNTKGDQEVDEYTDPEERLRAKALGDILRERRKKAGPDGGLLTQKILADAIGRSQPFITKAEHGRPIHIAELEQIAWQLGSTLSEVYRQLQNEAPRRGKGGPVHSEPDDS